MPAVYAGQRGCHELKKALCLVWTTSILTGEGMVGTGGQSPGYWQASAAAQCAAWSGVAMGVHKIDS